MPPVVRRTHTPRIILIADEVQELLADMGRVSAEAGRLLERLLRQGRAFGMHVIMGSQSLSSAHALGRPALTQIGIRIALQCSEADSRVLLGDTNSAASTLTRPGQAIYNAANGDPGGNRCFQVAHLSDAARQQILESLTRRARAADLEHSPLVFEGYARHPMSECATLRALIGADQPAPRPARLHLCLGAPVTINPHLPAALTRTSASNLLVAGRNEEMARSILLATTLGLAAQCQDSEIYLLDLAASESPTLRSLARLPNLYLGGHEATGDFITRVHATTTQRIAERATNAAPIVLVVHALHRAREIRADAHLGRRDGGELSLAARLQSVVGDGPTYGIFTLTWCDTKNTLTRALNRRALDYFSLRAVTQVGQRESHALIDTSVASTLGAYRALLLNEEDALIHKFTPYALPPADWLDDVTASLASKTPLITH